MNEENEQIAAPYRKPELAFENTSTGLHLIGCSRRDKAKLEQQNQQAQQQAQQNRIKADNLAKCLKDEEAKKFTNMQSLAELKRKGSNFDLETSLNNEEKTYQDKKADCFKKYPQ